MEILGLILCITGYIALSLDDERGLMHVRPFSFVYNFANFTTAIMRENS